MARRQRIKLAASATASVCLYEPGTASSCTATVTENMKLSRKRSSCRGELSARAKTPTTQLVKSQ